MTVLVTSRRKGATIFTHTQNIVTCQPSLYITIHTMDIIFKKERKSTSLTFNPPGAITGTEYKGVFTVCQTDTESRKVTLRKEA